MLQAGEQQVGENSAGAVNEPRSHRKFAGGNSERGSVLRSIMEVVAITGFTLDSGGLQSSPCLCLGEARMCSTADIRSATIRKLIRNRGS